MIIGKEPLFDSMELYVCISEAESLLLNTCFKYVSRVTTRIAIGNSTDVKNVRLLDNFGLSLNLNFDPVKSKRLLIYCQVISILVGGRCFHETLYWLLASSQHVAWG